MVGPSGRVIAADLQAGMLQKLRHKIEGSDLQERIVLHQCAKNRLGVTAAVDFVLAFYMVHEIPDQERFFSELRLLLRPGGRIFIVEPPLHTSRKAFESSIQKARDAGLMAVERPRLFLDKAVILQRV
jgi:ubiquinone/menaquinone biosynthesis C-methylase UbiE